MAPRPSFLRVSVRHGSLRGRRQRLHQREKVLRFAGAEIRVPRFERIGPENTQTPDDLLCPQQGARAARGDQIPVRDRWGVHKIRLSLVAAMSLR